MFLTNNRMCMTADFAQQVQNLVSNVAWINTVTILSIFTNQFLKVEATTFCVILFIFRSSHAIYRIRIGLILDTKTGLGSKLFQGQKVGKFGDNICVELRRQTYWQRIEPLFKGENACHSQWRINIGKFESFDHDTSP